MIRQADQQAIAEAATRLRAGRLVAFPTETVYGLGADAGNPQAVARVFSAKGRPADHPLIVHIAGAEALGLWAAEIPKAAADLAASFWPGPLTLILRKRPEVPDAVTGGQDSVGLRVPAHPVALALLGAFGGGVAAPSANRFGHVSPTTAAHVAGEFPGQDLMILDGGACRVGIESTIIDFTATRARLLRPGGLASADIAQVLGYAPEPPGRDAPRASGTLAQHYAPRTATRLAGAGEIDAACEGADASTLAVLARRAGPETFSGLWLRAPADAEDYARQLYAALRLLDASGAQRILIEATPQAPAWEAVNDRLRRASAGMAGSGP